MASWSSVSLLEQCQEPLASFPDYLGGDGRGAPRQGDPAQSLSPISTAACVKLDACIPNFALQEYTGESDPAKLDRVVQPLVLKDGYLEVPDAPGLGIKLNDKALARLELGEVV